MARDKGAKKALSSMHSSFCKLIANDWTILQRAKENITCSTQSYASSCFQELLKWFLTHIPTVSIIQL